MNQKHKRKKILLMKIILQKNCAYTETNFTKKISK